MKKKTSVRSGLSGCWSKQEFFLSFISYFHMKEQHNKITTYVSDIDDVEFLQTATK